MKKNSNITSEKEGEEQLPGLASWLSHHSFKMVMREFDPHTGD